MVNIHQIKRIALVALLCLAGGCKEFLTVEPLDRLTGNNFYLSRDDVEAALANMYSLFFDKLSESWVIGAVGEARSGEMRASPEHREHDTKEVVEVLGKNQLLRAMNTSLYNGLYRFDLITNWENYYKVIQSANILIDKLQEGIPGLSAAETDRYIAESTFMRCFTYFWMVRLYGDVVYYTDPYHSDPLPREDMVSVINKCIADLAPHKDNIPWVYGDVALRGARASRGSVIALLMHMNMWNAGFDLSNRESYYRQTATLGEEIVNSGPYRLLPMDDDGWAEVTKGRSEESVFEFYRSINYGDNVRLLAAFGDHFLRWPYKHPRQDNFYSQCYYTAEYMERLFPSGEGDNRKEVWFENMLADNGLFTARKFGLNVYGTDNESTNPDNTYMIFRYAGVILLWAEALAEVAENDKAVTALNMVRQRAGAAFYQGGGGQALKDAIFLERNREMFGEGHRYFDLIRTRRILNSTWTAWPLNLDQFNRRAWTWPISGAALQFNPEMVLNDYWLPGGGGS
ncbi:RagB/SusD family nutrient uptake outer membrane protein [Parapedobacter sp. 10938]|uniref:RagB/SusD family nutrient uptake outer membrane protein n=1 Tax=Parapedobacter flavus TaxID=3110225 RepID=UPI002DB8AD7B|nr:RagB/SusD family nutrient uptake outer membrane protein [Parapedobacter sp. 10938]MEC3881119.1 RagB/SusD family nutrient uptake outer membrane protein [Parapedobacter sp. 10938]